MAEEPQPSNVTEGADPPDALPANAEDRKAAKAMSSLGAKTEDAPEKAKKEVDVAALNEALKYLSAGQDSGGGKKKTAASKKKGDEEARKPLVKVDAADVALVVSETSRAWRRDADPIRSERPRN